MEPYIVLDRKEEEEDGRIIYLRLNSAGVAGWYDEAGILLRYASWEESEAGKRAMWPQRKPKPVLQREPVPLSDESMLICLLAAERRENEALRKYMDWQARRINDLELRLNTLGVK